MAEPAQDLRRLPGARAGRDPDRAIKRGPSRLPPEVVAATQRERLFDGLVHTVAQKGYVNARVGDICLAAGVTRPAFYSHFQGKEDAFLATYRHGTDLLWSLLETAYTAVPHWPDALRSGLRLLLSVLAGVPNFARMAIVEIDAVGPAGWAARDALLLRFHTFFDGAPRPVVTSPGGLTVDHEALVGSVVGGIYATIHRHVAAGEHERLTAQVPALTYFALVPFLGPGAAAAALDGDGEEGPVVGCSHAS
ncbi:hypothetical protein Val02_23680 [Virgisporangium aliadipatigenens]|uniref:HTH tetR-type domain-containing protein n=1 Tax=Virgisporangium aliadipatigenens TaxID=741659 RepID=A0A8J3YJE4_9ACTN|nr:TetR/AcrR family transcriptional regulator [Virgisporangium aliadipatigenens]GIJ45482.1 hypothetical protein Val02_23680 [Virgisporangium aliadipatigenens]